MSLFAEEHRRLSLVKEMVLMFLAYRYPAKYTLRSIANNLFHQETDTDCALRWLVSEGLVERSESRVDVYFGATLKGNDSAEVA